MVMDEHQNDLDIEIKMSKNDLPIPCVNGSHLHSTYNPVKEAEGLIRKNMHIIEDKKSILVMGLGFGYHITELIKQLKTFWGADFKILVIDPSNEIFEELQNFQSSPFENTEIISGQTVDELYQNQTLIQFLVNRPGMLAHPASFNLNEKYFKSFMSFRSKKLLDSIIPKIKSHDIRDYLKQFKPDLTLTEVFHHIKTKRSELTEEDFRILCFESIIKAKGNNLSNNEAQA
jgi:hypothetical protein